ncbi:MAG: divalent-cation tolerance protein CutA [Hyphomicrobiales bacterium]|nr:divalent-cation tolerance protein CutA [Hyphomicrobiales bacterium]
MSGFSIALTTIDTQDNADALIALVLDARLAACVQASAVVSHYVWRGERKREPEVLLQMKIRTADWERLRALVRERHPYETPEIVRVDIAHGDADYLRWIGDVTG